MNSWAQIYKFWYDHINIVKHAKKYHHASVYAHSNNKKNYSIDNQMNG